MRRAENCAILDDVHSIGESALVWEVAVIVNDIEGEAMMKSFQWRRSHFALLAVLVVIALIVLGRFVFLAR